MTANGLARVLLFLLGADMVLEFLFVVGQSFATASIMPDVPLGRQLWQHYKLVQPALVSTGAFVLLPGLILISRNSVLANWFFPITDTPPTKIESATLLGVGAAILGCYFIVSGLGTFASSLFYFVADEEMVFGSTYLWGSLFESTLTMICGAFLLVFGRRAA